MKRVLITGATGFIGSALAKYLRPMNYHLVGLTRSIKLLPTNKQNLVDEWIECNLADDEFNYEVMSNVDYVVHLAGNAHLTKEAAYSEYYRNNTVATKKLATVAAQYSVEKFIFVSTIKVNGDNSESESNFTFTEDSDVNPADYYSQSKYEAEKVLKDICQLHEMDFVILRPPLVYGAGVKANFLSLMRVVNSSMPLPMASLKSNRSFIYVDNLVDIIEKCISSDNLNDSLYLVHDLSVSLPDLLRQLSIAMSSRTILFPFPLSLLSFFCGLVGKKPVLDKLTSSLIINDTKMRNELAWRPKISFEDSIIETVKWFKQGRDCERS